MENENENEIINKNINNGNVGESCVDGLQEVIDFYNNNIGIITPFGLELLTGYVQEMGKDIVIYAMQISVEANKRTIQYIKAILNNWSNNGVKTLIEAKEQSRKQNNQKQNNVKQLNYPQRNYTKTDFDKFYANKGG